MNRYVKVEGSNAVHSTLIALSDMCETVTDETAQLRNLEKEKHRLFAEARAISSSLISDLTKLDGFFNGPHHPAAKPKIAKRPVIKKTTKPVKKKSQPKQSKKIKITPKRPTPKKQVAKVKVAKQVSPRSRDEDPSESLKRLKANLNAIRASLK